VTRRLIQFVKPKEARAKKRETAAPKPKTELRVIAKADPPREKPQSGLHMMKIKTIICNCKGINLAFKNADMNTLPFELESELDLNYAVVHPEICGPGGSNLLHEILGGPAVDSDTYVVCCGCASEMQSKLLTKVIRKTDFDPNHFIAIDIQGLTNEAIVTRVKERVTQVAEKRARKD
jgi:hypothetical protein